MTCTSLYYFVVTNAVLLFLVLSEVDATATRTVRRQQNHHWVDTWASMPQLTEPSNLPPAPYNETGRVFRDSTIRQSIHTSIGGSKIRLRISNVFGGSDLPITAVSIALPTNGSAGVSTIQPKTVRAVTFSGNSSFTVPNGALVISDPIDFKVNPQSMLTVTIYTAEGQTTNSITSHPGSRTTSWFSQGNSVMEATLANSSLASAAHWYFLSAVEVWVPLSSRAFVIVGDSITDGRGSDTDRNNRWPDLVLAKMQKHQSVSNIAVVNLAAGGNRVLADGLGPNAVGRIDRDVLSHSGVAYAMIFEGVNDIGVADTTVEAQNTITDRLIWAYKQMVTHIHALGIPVFGATITPFNGTSSVIADPLREASRQRVNNFIRQSGIFDAVIDFDSILRDPANPAQLAAKYDSGDQLHPNVAGYQALADAFPLDVFDIDFVEGYD